MNRRLFNRKDIGLIASIVALAVGLYVLISFLGPREAMYARISVSSHAAIYLPLSQETDFVLPQHPAIRFRVTGQTVYFAASDCPDQICVHTGPLHRAGQTAACLPNRVVVTIVGPTDSGIDLVLP